MSRRYNIYTVISATIYINVHDRRRFHDRLQSSRFFIMQNTSSRYIDILQYGFNSSNRFMSHNVVYAMLVKMMFEFAIGYSYSGPIIIIVVDVPFTTVKKNELSIPIALVTVSKELTVQSYLTFLKIFFVSGALRERRGMLKSIESSRSFSHS